MVHASTKTITWYFTIIMLRQSYLMVKYLCNLNAQVGRSDCKNLWAIRQRLKKEMQLNEVSRTLLCS